MFVAMDGHDGQAIDHALFLYVSAYIPVPTIDPPSTTITVPVT